MKAVTRRDIHYILSLALSKEDSSIETYRDLIVLFKDLSGASKETKDLLLLLLKEEKKHKRLINKLIRQLVPQQENKGMKG